MHREHGSEVIPSDLAHADLRIVLLGKTGTGKSATGNTILREAFKADRSPVPVTKRCTRQSGEVAGRIIDVIDTPGICDELFKDTQAISRFFRNKVRPTGEAEKDPVAKCITVSDPGPHVFLLVIRLDSYTLEERNTVKWIQENFGKGAQRYMIILFTYGDHLGQKSIDEFVKESKELKALVHSCGSRYCMFNNKEKNDLTQVTKLLEKIDEMVKSNEDEGGHYTHDMYLEAQRELKRKQNVDVAKEVAIKVAVAAFAAFVVALLFSGACGKGFRCIHMWSQSAYQMTSERLVSIFRAYANQSHVSENN